VVRAAHGRARVIVVRGDQVGEGGSRVGIACPVAGQGWKVGGERMLARDRAQQVLDGAEEQDGASPAPRGGQQRSRQSLLPGTGSGQLLVDRRLAAELQLELAQHPHQSVFVPGHPSRWAIGTTAGSATRR
jgi:hypothetical protein